MGYFWNFETAVNPISLYPFALKCLLSKVKNISWIPLTGVVVGGVGVIIVADDG